MKVFAIFDVKVEAYLQPFFARTVGEGLRIFVDAVQAEGSRFARHAEDFTLFEVAEWSEEGGDFLNGAANKPLGCAIEYLTQEEG